MPSRLPAVLLVVVVALLGPACGGDGDGSTTPTRGPTTGTQTETETRTTEPTRTGATTPTPRETDEVVEIVYESGAVQGGRQTIESGVGETLRLRIVADVEDEIHVHGYDVFADVVPGQPAELELTTDIPGVFEIELEQLGAPIAELEVR